MLSFMKNMKNEGLKPKDYLKQIIIIILILKFMMIVITLFQYHYQTIQIILQIWSLKIRKIIKTIKEINNYEIKINKKYIYKLRDYVKLLRSDSIKLRKTMIGFRKYMLKNSRKLKN